MYCLATLSDGLTWKPELSEVLIHHERSKVYLENERRVSNIPIGSAVLS